MREMARLGLILMTMGLICAAALGFVNSQTKDRIAIQRELARQEAMNLVASSLGSGLTFDSIEVQGLSNPYPETGRTLSPVRVSSSGNPVGYVFTAYRKGYSSVIETLVAVDLEGTIAGSTILFQAETPGLGTRYTDPSWQARLVGQTSPALEKDGGEIAGVTGATVSGRAIVGSVADGIEALRAAGLFDEGGGL